MKAVLDYLEKAERLQTINSGEIKEYVEIRIVKEALRKFNFFDELQKGVSAYEAANNDGKANDFMNWVWEQSTTTVIDEL